MAVKPLMYTALSKTYKIFCKTLNGNILAKRLHKKNIKNKKLWLTNQKTSDIIKSSKEREVTNMRKVNYRVRKADGTEFHTTSYREATDGGNRIEETYLTKIDERTEEQKERARAHARKIQEILKAKRA